jgi:hypothetical protein
MHKPTVWTNRLVVMVLHYHGLTRKPGEKKWCQSGACNVNDFRPTDQLPKANQTWRTDNAKWQRAIIKIAGCGLRDKR